jgi:protoporphyrinogen/coproporphyrinogen III oxidase
MARRVVVLGGGISGLTFAWALRRAAGQAVKVTVLESANRFGGWLHSHRDKNGFLFERGCRSLRGGTAGGDGAVVLQTLEELGLHEGRAEGRALANSAAARSRYLLFENELTQFPNSPMGLLGWKPLPSPWRTLLGEAFRPRKGGSAPDQDETVESFISRRLSPEIAQNLLDPVVAGVWAGRVDELSAMSVLPSLVALEASAGSLTLGMAGVVARAAWHKAKSIVRTLSLDDPSGRVASLEDFTSWHLPHQPWFQDAKSSLVSHAVHHCRASDFAQAFRGASSLSFTNGTGTLPAALEAELRGGGGVELLNNVTISRVGAHPSGPAQAVVSLAPSRDRPAMDLEADVVMSAVPSPSLATLLPSKQASEREIHELLLHNPWASVAIGCVGYSTQAIRRGAGRSGFGFLAPTSQATPQGLLGTVWDSCVFPGQALDGRGGDEDRASVMMGGRRAPWVADAPPEQIQGIALESLRAHTGVEVAPTALDVHVAREAIPQYTVGHLARLNRLEVLVSQQFPWLRLLGNSYYGVGAAACISNARAAAVAMVDQIV